MNKSLGWFLTVAATPLIVLGTLDCPAGEEAGGPGPAPLADTSDQESERDALRAMLPVYEQAANEGKLDALEPYLDDEFTGVMVTSNEVDSFQSLKEYWETIQGYLGESGSYRVKVNVAGPAALTPDVAVAHGTTEEEVVTSVGNRFNYTGQWTAVLRKRDGEWKILRIHGSMDPINNPFVSTMGSSMSIVYGLIGLAVGAIVGWIAHLLIARRGAATQD